MNQQWLSSNWRIAAPLFVLLIAMSNCNPAQQTLETAQAPVESTPIPTETVHRTATTAPTRSLALPLMPTLSAVQAEAKLRELLRDPSCRLPCFLGIVPGQTDKNQAISILRQFDTIFSGTEIRVSQGDLTASLDVITQNGFSNDHPEVVKWTEAEMLMYREAGNTVEKAYQSSSYGEYFQHYTLPYLLSEYGTPDQAYVFLDTGIADMGLGIDLYLLHLDYSHQGWVAHLEMPLYVEDEMFIGCPSEAFTSLRLWSPESPARDYELSPDVLFTIEEATGLTLEEFHQKFKDPTTTDCFKTLSNIHKP